MGTKAELAAHFGFPETGRLSADITSQLDSASFDQLDYQGASALAVVVWEATTASGQAGDEIDFTVDIDDSADDSSFTTQKTLSKSVVVADNDTEHTGMLFVPVNNLNGLRRYVKATVALAAGTGAPTISASAGSVCILPLDLTEAPESNYDVDGFGVETVNSP